MVSEPILISKESLAKADWEEINNDLKAAFNGDAQKGLHKLMSFAYKHARGNHLDCVLSSLSRAEKCKIGISINDEKVKFV